jgi:hypothetical protein
MGYAKPSEPERYPPADGREARSAVAGPRMRGVRLDELPEADAGRAPDLTGLYLAMR